MTLPATVKVSFDFSSGPVFGLPLTLGDSENGILGTNVLAAQAAFVVDLTNTATSIKIRRGRDLIQDQFNAGTCTVRVIDETGQWNPQNTASQFYPLLEPLRKLRISAEYEGILHYLFSGYTTEYRYTFPKNEELGYVDIIASDAFNLFNKSAVTTVAGSNAGDLTGTRVNQILDQIGFPTGQRGIDAGDSTVQDDPGTLRSVLQALKDVEFSEFGGLYMSAGGDVIFRERTDALETIGGTPTVFDQGSNINYSSLRLAFDDKLVFNVANFKRIGGSMVQVIDQPSIDKYFPHTITKEDLLNQTDSEVGSLARAYIASRAKTDIRIDAITLDLLTPNYDAGVTAALTLDFFSPVQITNIQPGGSTITKTLQVFGVTHDITPNSWFTTFTTSEPLIDGFILGSSVAGILGDDVLAY
jgi:hypothetical protein